MPPLIGWSNGPQRVGVGLQRTGGRIDGAELGAEPGRSAAPRVRSIRLAFPLGIGGQGPRAGLGPRRVRFAGCGELPPPAVQRGLADVDVDRLGSLGRSSLRTVFAIDQGARDLERGPTSYVTVAHKVLPSWSLALLGLSLIAPALVASIDGLARARRRREPVARWARWVLVAGLPCWSCSCWRS